jgi:hypothetical protein
VLKVLVPFSHRQVGFNPFGVFTWITNAEGFDPKPVLSAYLLSAEHEAIPRLMRDMMQQAQVASTRELLLLGIFE